MAANPISYSEIEAYCRLSLIQPTAWEVGVLRRLDQAVLKVAGEKAKRATRAKDEPAAIPVQNTGAVRALFTDIAIRKRAEAEAKDAKPGKPARGRA